MHIRSDLSPCTSLNLIGFMSRLVSTTRTSSSSSRPQILQCSFIVSLPFSRGFFTLPCTEPAKGLNVSVFALIFIPHFQLIIILILNQDILVCLPVQYLHTIELCFH